MKLTLKPTIPVFLGAVLSLTAVQGSSPDRVGSYDFSYQTTGDQRVRPAQVFDDGKSTYFQFRSGEPVPAILAESPSGPILMVPELEGPYVRVTSVSGAFILRLGYGVGRVSYLGEGRSTSVPARDAAPASLDAPPASMQRLLAASAQIQGIPPEMVAPSPPVALHVNSYATPIKGDLAEWTAPPKLSDEVTVPFVSGASTLGPQGTRIARSFAQRFISANRIVVTGIDDAAYGEGVASQRARAVGRILAQAGVPVEKIIYQESAQPRAGGTGGVVIGVALVAHVDGPTVASKAPTNYSTTAPAAQVQAIVAQLQTGQLSPSQAVAALDRARTMTSPSAAAAAAPAAQKQWEVRAADGTVANMLKRWGDENGWRVVIQQVPEVKIHGDASFERAGFLQAADYVVSQAKQAGFSIKAVAYQNNVLVLSEEEK